jgi:Rad3-related DNA helicase
MLEHLDESKIDECFPLENYRTFQRETIQFIIRAINSGKKYIIAECPTGSGKCLHEDTLVALKNGERIRIADLSTRIGEQLHSIDGNLKNSSCRLLNHMCSGLKNCFEVKTSSGKSIISTMDHRFLCIDGWKELKKINVGDHLAVNKSLEPSSVNDIITDSEHLIDIDDIDVTWDRIVSISPVGEKLTYDIEVSSIDGYEPNFSANGIITHNSAIAMTIAKMAESHKAYYITTTKMLQDQIENDYPYIATLKGRSSYPCTAYDKFADKLVNILGPKELERRQSANYNCNEGYCKSTGKSSCNMCMSNLDGIYSHCEYYDKMGAAVNAQTASMNFDNFILHMNYGQSFSGRGILIIDESHNTEDKLLEFMHCTIESSHLHQEVPELEEPLEYISWLMDIGALNVLKKRLMDASNNADIKEMNYFESLIKKYMRMILEVREDPNGWICEFNEDKRLGTSKATLKPIYSRKAAQKYLFCHTDVVVMLSATILNAKIFANNLGIPNNDFAAISIPSTFPVQNRPVYIDYVGKFTGGKAQMENWMPVMKNKIEQIIDKYPNQKGIIHAHSFAIQKWLADNLRTDIKKRLLQQHDFFNKTDM